MGYTSKYIKISILDDEHDLMIHSIWGYTDFVKPKYVSSEQWMRLRFRYGMVWVAWVEIQGKANDQYRPWTKWNGSNMFKLHEFVSNIWACRPWLLPSRSWPICCFMHRVQKFLPFGTTSPNPPSWQAESPDLRRRWIWESKNKPNPKGKRGTRTDWLDIVVYALKLVMEQLRCRRLNMRVSCRFPPDPIILDKS